jgi:peptidoglycan-associated lipoprotein
MLTVSNTLKFTALAALLALAACTTKPKSTAEERGTREYNLALGARRANSVKEFLVSEGVSSARVDTISYGKERPICTESNEGCWAQNRRGVSTIVSGATS